TKSIGVAIGQRITGTARPLPAIKAQDGTPDWTLIERLLKEWHYPADKKEVLVQLMNQGNRSSLVQSWIDDGDSSLPPEKIHVPF
ncbi:Holliday junction resolvase RuvX, partial [Salmonella enterica subsp. enterica serovar Montevideo]|nr:Holliday junction resolvase RuvX [Salmonella enterica subsp. enterica serovar Montevideo]